MQKSLKLLYSLLAILVLVGVVYFVLRKPATPPTPYQVITPTNYPEGTTMSLYKTVPAEFPQDVILEDKTLEDATVVTTKDGKTQVTVAYMSALKVPALTAMYKKSLSDEGWKVYEKVNSPNISVMLATKEGEELVTTFVQADKEGTSATFQYQK